MVDKVYSQFAEWLKKQTYWIQDAAWRLYNKQEIDDKKIEEYILMCMLQIQKKNCAYMQLSDTAIMPTIRKSRLSVKSIMNVENVNALADNTGLQFGSEGISVIYGLNGAGKSGFMRIFKHVSGNPYAEPIQHNVYKKTSSDKVKCKIAVCLDEEEEIISCNLGIESLDSRLRQCDVFDTRISGAYVSSSNSVSYEPFVFSVLRDLAVIAGRIEFAVKAKMESIPLTTPAIPKFIVGLEEASWLSNICETTVIPENCKIWLSTDVERLDELKNLLDTKQVESELQNCTNQKKQLQNVLSDIQNLKLALLGPARQDLIDLHKTLSTAKSQYELARRLFAENASEYDEVSVCLAEWRELWKIGRQYYDVYLHEKNGYAFGQIGSVCPVCLRELDNASVKRFASVDEYVNGNCSEVYTKAQTSFKRKLAEILNHTYTCKVVLTVLDGMVNEELLSEVLALYTTVESLEKTENYEIAYDTILKIKNIPVVDRLEAFVSVLDEQIRKLSDSLDIKNQKELEIEFAMLRYRYWVNSQLNIIEPAISNMRKKAELTTVLSLVKTNRITTESNILAEALITDAYIVRFSNELKRLAPNLRVKLEKGQSVKGKSPYKVVLDTQDKARKTPQEVLSEGEQRIVSLAAFFADATGRNESTPIIIDDPISSLDYNYEEAATKRIVELAKERQVIVFTHRISLLVGLSEQSVKAGVPFVERHIRGTLNGKGVSDFEETYHGNIIEQLTGIQARIRDTKKINPDSHEYMDSCSRISQQLRICVERSVEDILFQQMVKRFTRRIMTGKLMRMNRITEDDCAIIDSMMTKYSFNEHSQPDDSGLITMNLDDTIQDIDIFIRWIKTYNKKMNEK